MPNLEPAKAGRRIPIAEPSLGLEEEQNVLEAVRTNWVGSKGAFVNSFEEGFARAFGVAHGISICNGTAALHLALLACGVGPGDEVLVPALTFVASANAVLYCGAKPVFVDAHPAYWGMDPEDLRRKATARTKAVIPVHLYGHACDMDPIMALAEEKGLSVIEDAAEAPGAEYKGRKVGSFGRVSCFSFYGNKILTTGEGGMCLTDDQALNDKIRLLRDHGMRPRSKHYIHDVVGYNYRMTNLQAALGVAQLKKFGEFLAQRRRIADWYGEFLAGEPQITLHPEMPWSRNAVWLYSVLVPAAVRDAAMAAMDSRGVETRPFFLPMTELPTYPGEAACPEASRLSARGINLPTSVRLGKDDVRHICGVLKDSLNELARPGRAT